MRAGTTSQTSNGGKRRKLPTCLILDTNGRLTNSPDLGSPAWPSPDIERARAAVADLTGFKVPAARAKIIGM